MEEQVFDNVWDALCDTREEAEHMTLKSDLLIEIERAVKAWNLTQSAAAERLGITQPRLNDLLRGRINRFSLEALVDLASRAGLKIRLSVAA